MICDFCKKEVTPGKGKLKILNSAKILRFCSRRCDSHHSLKRNIKTK